jgi:antitoxin (DNA-binding transcriptional repressor) of toxin-antitoxin stability system
MMDKKVKEYAILTATEASRSFSELLHRVCYGGESFLVKKGNRLMARIVPVEEMTAEMIPEQDEPYVVHVPAPVEEPVPDGVTPEEAEYFKTVIEQLRKSTLEPA